MKRNHSFYLPAILTFVGFVLPVGCGQQPEPAEETTETIGQINRVNPAINELIAQDAQIEVLAEGFEWTEGPAWRKTGEYVLFSDIPQNTIFKWDESTGLSVYLRPAGYIWSDPPGRELGTNGLMFDSQDRLLACDHGNRALVRIDESNFTKTILADHYEGKRLNSPNDLVIKSTGDIYFTDPPYGLRGTNESPLKELDYNGVYKIDGQDSTLSLFFRDLTRPNGIALSPDEKTLYVANSDPKKAIWMAFELDQAGGLLSARTFFNATSWVEEGRKGLPDGMTVDHEGNLFATGPGGVNVFSPSGEHLGTIETGQATANCTFGGPDGSILYITADMYFCRVQTRTKGLGF